MMHVDNNDDNDALESKKWNQINEAIEIVLQHNFDKDSQACFKTCLKLLDNILQQPLNDKVRSIRIQNPNFFQKVGNVKGGIQLLLACQFEIQQPIAIGVGIPNNNDIDNVVINKETMLVLKEEKEDTKLIVHARHSIAKAAIHQLQMKPDELPTFKPPAPKPILTTTSSTTSNNVFNPYASNRHDGQAASVGTQLYEKDYKSTTEQQLQLLQSKQESILNKTTNNIDRNWIVNPIKTSSNNNNNDAGSENDNTTTSTSSNTRTVSDSTLLAQHAKQKLQQRQAQENAGFQTKAMRDLAKLKKTTVYNTCTLQITFPDGTILQGNFHPNDTIRAVTQGIIQDCLVPAFSDNNNNINNRNPELFDLYITPPRTVLQSKTTLQQAQLVPAAKVFVSWKVSPSSIPTPYLQPHLLQAAATASAEAAAAFGTGTKLVLDDAEMNNKDEKDKKSAAKGGNNKKSKKSKSDKEQAMLKRMMGGM